MNKQELIKQIKRTESETNILNTTLNEYHLELKRKLDKYVPLKEQIRFEETIDSLTKHLKYNNIKLEQLKQKMELLNGNEQQQIK